MSLDTIPANPTPDTIAAFRRRLSHVLSYEPSIAFFGKTGVGKSSLCNALFGKPVFPVSDVGSCTRTPAEMLLELPSQGLKLIDVPGVGEHPDLDPTYEALYRELLPELDAVIWVLRADERAFGTDIDAYRRLLRPWQDAEKPFLIVLNQIDKVEPFREWQQAEGRPGPTQEVHIAARIAQVAELFHVKPETVIPVSAAETYNLHGVIDGLLHRLPRDKAIALMRETPSSNTCDACETMIAESLWAIFEEAGALTFGERERSAAEALRLLETAACTALDRFTKFVERMTLALG